MRLRRFEANRLEDLRELLWNPVSYYRLPVGQYLVAFRVYEGRVGFVEVETFGRSKNYYELRIKFGLSG
jgi:hypothetical protein